MADHRMSAQHRSLWCAALAKLVSPGFAEQAAEALRDMLPMLRDLPDEAFCTGSLEAAALAKRRTSVPALDELRGAVGGWWRENRPRLPAIPASVPQGRGDPSVAEVEHVTASLTAWRQERRQQEQQPQTAPERPRARFATAEQLLAAYEKQVAEGGRFAEAARARVAWLSRIAADGGPRATGGVG